jgi:hypothetical protein
MALALAERRKPSGDWGLNRASKTPDGSRHSAYMTHKVSAIWPFAKNGKQQLILLTAPIPKTGRIMIERSWLINDCHILASARVEPVPEIRLDTQAYFRVQFQTLAEDVV